MAEESRLEIVVDSRQAEGSVRRVRNELQSIEGAADDATRATDKFGNSLNGADIAAGRYVDSAGRVREANGRFATGFSAAGRALDGVTASSAKASRGFMGIARQAQFAVPPVGQLTTLFGSLAGVLGAREIIQYADAWQNAGNQLRQVTDTTEELERIQSSLMGVANETRSAFEPTANLYSRLARATTEMGLSQQDLIGLTRTINQSFAVSGATAGEAAAAITQLSQGLAAGALRGDEFNSVSEQAPGIMRAIAESLDMTIGDLRDFAAEGGITAQIVVEALQGASDSIENDFGRSVETFGQKITIARNNLLQFVGASDTVDGALGNLGDAAITLSESLDAVAQASILLGGVVAGRLVGRLATLAAGLTTAAGAATALRTALAFVGGPAGVAVAAAAGLYAFREELGLVPDPTRKAREEIDLLIGSLDDMNAASIDAAMIAINAQMFDLEKRAREARAEIERINDEQNTPGPLRNSIVGPAGDARRDLTEIQTQQAAIEGRREELLKLREGLDAAGDSGDVASDALTNLGKTADDLVEKFRPMLNQDVEDILERAGEGSTIDDKGQIRDAWGNALPSLQRELDAELKDQVAAFRSEQNLQAGLEAAAQAFVDGAGDAASKAWSFITPMSADEVAGNQGGGLVATGDQDSVPALAGAAERNLAGGVMATGEQGSAPPRWSTDLSGGNGGGNKQIGTLRLVNDKGDGIDVFTENPEIAEKWLADTLTRTAAGRR